MDLFQTTSLKERGNIAAGKALSAAIIFIKNSVFQLSQRIKKHFCRSKLYKERSNMVAGKALNVAINFYKK